MEDVSLKVCPFCKEQIRKEAVKCRFCGEWLEQNAQTQPSVETPPPIPPKLENPPTVVSVQQEVKKEIPPEILSWISAALLLLCGLVLFVGLAGTHWTQMSPAKQGKAIANITFGLIIALVSAGLLAWRVERKRYRLLTFSIICTICTGVGIYNFQKAQQKRAESNRQLNIDISRLQEFVQNGAVGDFPEFHLTGDPDMDAFFRATRDFYTDYFRGYRKMRQKTDALQARNVFDDVLLTNRFYLKSEIQKRIESRMAIGEFATNTLPMIEALRRKCGSLNVAEEFKAGVLEGFDAKFPQFRAMFAAWTGEQKAEQDFLQFLDGNFEDYELKDRKILFGKSTNSQKYLELAKSVQDAHSETEEFQKQGMALLEAAKLKFR